MIIDKDIAIAKMFLSAITLDKIKFSGELAETPRRIISAYREMLSGYNQPLDSMSIPCFDSSNNQMIVVKDIDFVSMCEHHLLPFTGVAHVGYLPNGKVIGLSKIPRIVNAFSKRLQLQERLTEEIAKFINDTIHPLGVGVVIEARHFCTCYRGVKSQNAKMVTSYITGSFRNDEKAKTEFFAIVQNRMQAH